MKTHGNRRGGSAAPQHEKSLQEYVAMLLRGKWLVLLVAAGVLIASFVITKLMDPVYKASTQVLLSASELRSSIFLDAVRPDRVQNITQNELTILTSRTLADTVAHRLLEQRTLEPGGTELLPILKPDPGFGGTDSVASLALVSGRLTGLIDFEPIRESDVITITAESGNPLEAALIANTFAHAYRDRNIYLSRSKSRSFKDFLADQAEEKRRALEQTEGSLQQYMERQGIVSLDDESKKVIDQLGQLEATRDATEISLRQKRNTLASYQAELPQQETNVARVMGEASDPYIRLLQEQLAKLEVQRDVTIAQNPAVMGRELVNERVKEVDNQIASLRQRLQKRTDEFLRTLTPAQGGGPGDAASYLQSVKQKIIETQIEVDALESKKKALQEVIRTYEGQFERIPRKSVELARLQRSRLTNEKLYLMIEEKYNEANITEKSNIGYVEIIEPAAIPRRPSSPKLPLNLAIGLVLGFALGVGIVLTREIMHERVFSPEDVRRHGLVPLTTVVEADEESAGPRGGDGGTDAGRLGRLPLVTLHAPFSPIAESYRQLRTNIQFGKTGSAVSTILVTSPTPGEGKSTTASNLAVAFAQAGKKVLLVDGDLRMPTLDSAFTINRKPGLADMLKGEAHLDTAMHKTSVENLKVVPSGTLPPNPAELLSSEAMKDFLTVARRQFEIVVFDSSPVLAVTDPAVISTLVDATVLVVSAGKTAAKELESAVEVLRSIGTDPAGVVLNGFDPRQAYGFSYGRSKRHYYYGYGTPKGSMGVSAKKVVIEQKEQGG